MTANRATIADWFERFKRLRGPLRKLLITRGAAGAHDLDDLAQEVFFRLLRHEGSLEIEHPEAYLLRMAANLAGEWALLARHRLPHGDKWLDELTSPSLPEDGVARAAAHKEFRAELDALPVRQREVLRLRFGEGLTREEIAAHLKISERIVKRDLITAYAALRTPQNAELAQVLNATQEECNGPD